MCLHKERKYSFDLYSYDVCFLGHQEPPTSLIYILFSCLVVETKFVGWTTCTDWTNSRCTGPKCKPQNTFTNISLFSEVEGERPVGRSWSTFTLLPSQRIILMQGGFSNNDQPLDDVWHLDLVDFYDLEKCRNGTATVRWICIRPPTAPDEPNNEEDAEIAENPGPINQYRRFWHTANLMSEAVLVYGGMYICQQCLNWSIDIRFLFVRTKFICITNPTKWRTSLMNKWTTVCMRCCFDGPISTGWSFCQRTIFTCEITIFFCFEHTHDALNLYISATLNLFPWLSLPVGSMLYLRPLRMSRGFPLLFVPKESSVKYLKFKFKD
jgi:hypothetical protein